MNVPGKAKAGHDAMDFGGFGPRDADDDQLHLRIDLAQAQQTIEDPDQKRNIFVASMLRSAKQKRLIFPVRYWRVSESARRGFHAVVDPHSLVPRMRDVPFQPSPRSFRDTG